MKTRLRVSVLHGLAVIAVLTSATMSQAQKGEDKSYQALSDKFFNLLSQDKTSDAVDFLFETNPAMQKVTDDVQQLKSQFASIGPLMGPYVSHTKLIETKVAGMFVYQHYFVAYQRQPISVRIEYYKPGTKWACYGLQFDVKLTEKIKAASDEKIPLE